MGLAHYVLYEVDKPVNIEQVICSDLILLFGGFCM